MAMTQVRYEFLLECTTAVAHAEGTIGNVSVAMRAKMRQPDGAFAMVPVVTADTMRHGLREAVVYATLDAAGLLDGDGPGLTEGALRLLFNGGMLTGRGDATAVSLTEWRRLLSALPHLALFGGCANNRMLPGQLQVGAAALVCDETRHLVPAWVLARAGATTTCRAHIEEETRVRMDATREPQKARLLERGARDALERRLLASEAAHDADDAVAREASKSTMLPRSAEVVCAGSLLSWDVTATVYDALELDALHTALAAFAAGARVGGKRGTGHGKLRFVAGNRVDLARPREAAAAMDLAELAPQAGAVFRAHVAAHAADLRAALAAVDA